MLELGYQAVSDEARKPAAVHAGQPRLARKAEA